MNTITSPRVPWGCDYEKWVATVRYYVPLGPHGRAELIRLIARARAKDDARQLNEFFEEATRYVIRYRDVTRTLEGLFGAE